MNLSNGQVALRFRGADLRLARLEDNTHGTVYDIEDRGVSFLVAEAGAAETRVVCDAKSIAGKENGPGSLTVHHQIGAYDVRIAYSLRPGANFFEKSITIRGNTDFTLLEVSAGDYVFPTAPFREALPYSDLYYCPICVFLRGKTGGLFAGIENPVFKTEADKGKLRLSFEPSYKVKAGEVFQAENLFLGVFKNEGRYFAKECPDEFGWVPTRQRSDWPSMSHDTLDLGEIHAMQRFMECYMPPRFPGCARMMDGWWAQLPCLEPGDEHPQDVENVERIVDNLLQLDVHLMTLTAFPEKYEPPRDAKAGWRFNKNVEAVMKYGRRKGMSFGVYMGGASPYQMAGNSMQIDFCPDRPAWGKILDPAEKKTIFDLPTQCYGCDEFVDHIADLQANTIGHYKLGWWSWDGTLANERMCQAANHRHLSGKSAYAEFRGCTEVFRRLRERFPDLWLNIYWGVKPYGPWGLKHIDTHENYFEINCWDRAPWTEPIAHDGRLQFFWNVNSRFLPPYKNYAPVNRPIQGSGADQPVRNDFTSWVRAKDDEFAKGEYWEEFEWKNGLLSSIGTSASALLQAIPNDFSAIHSQDYAAFHRKWFAWADEHIGYLRRGQDLFGPPRIGHIDGKAHIVGDRGYVLLFNMNEKRLGGLLPLDSSIGLERGERFVLEEIYPREGRLLAVDGQGAFERGASVPVFVPARGCVVYELRPFDAKKDRMFGARGDVSVSKNGTAISISGVEGPIGATDEILVRADSRAKSLTVNGVAAPFRRRGGFLHAAVRFNGVGFPEELTEWQDARGKAIRLGEHLAIAKDAELTCRFFLPAELKQTLEEQKARPRPSGEPTPFQADAGALTLALNYKYPATLSSVMRCFLNGKEAKNIDVRGFAILVNLAGIATFGGENTLTLRHESLLPGQFTAARLLNIPQRMTAAVTPAALPSKVDRKSLTRAFCGLQDIRRQKERMAFGDQFKKKSKN